jgi:hypothetical protein
VWWLERSPITEALPGEAESLGVHEEARVSQGHVRRTAQKVARVRWLEAYGKELRTALWGTPQAAS